VLTLSKAIELHIRAKDFLLSLVFQIFFSFSEETRFFGISILFFRETGGVPPTDLSLQTKGFTQ
jgi:hypothetical protein